MSETIDCTPKSIVSDIDCAYDGITRIKKGNIIGGKKHRPGAKSGWTNCIPHLEHRLQP